MAVPRRRTRKPAARSTTKTTAQRKSGTPAAKRPPAKKATATRGAPKLDLTDYATKAPTDYHKAFAKWLVAEVGYAPTNRKDFLVAVSLATVLRPKFMESDFLQEWREEQGVTKRGPKPAAKATKSRKAPIEEPEDDEDFEDDEELEDDEEEFDEDDADEVEDEEDDFEDEEEDDSEDDEDFDEESEEDEDDFEDDEEEEEEPPPPTKTRRRPAAKKPAPKKAPAKGRKPDTKSSDDEFLF